AAADAATALEQARAFEAVWLPMLRPGWWRLRRVLRSSYNFKAHAVAPSWSRVLSWLCDEHAARDKARQPEADAVEEFSFGGSLADFLDSITQLRKEAETWPAVVNDVHRHCLESPGGGRLIARLGELRHLLAQLDKHLAGLLRDFEQRTFTD